MTYTPPDKQVLTFELEAYTPPAATTKMAQDIVDKAEAANIL